MRSNTRMSKFITPRGLFSVFIHSSVQFLWVLCALVLTSGMSAFAQADITAQYQWKPVRIGGGGWVVGMTVHPLDSTVRYARTDVGNAFRWDEASQQWYPMRVYNTDGSGVHQTAETSSPSQYGEDSIVVDPTNTSVVYMVFPPYHSCDVQCPNNYVEFYKSVDGGKNFYPGNMTAAGIKGDPNGNNRMDGEKLAVDPVNPSVLYYGSDSQGLYRSLDGGATWSQFNGAGAPPTNIEFVNIQFAKAPGTVTVNGVVLSKTIYAVSINNNSDAGGDVYQSMDGGKTWSDISTGVTDAASGQKLNQQALSSTIDSADALYVVENNATDGWRRAYWKYAAGKWARVSLEGFINQALSSVAVDPTNPMRIYAMGQDTGLSRSDDGGVTWKNLGSAQYANSLAWLPQTVGMAGGEWHSNGGVKVDSQGNLWSPSAQEGVITIPAVQASSATTANPPKWTITSKGIEELVTMDIVVPPGSNDSIVATAMDTTGFYIPNPDNFSAVQIPLQQEIIAQGTSVAYCPDVPTYIAVTSSNVYNFGTNYSGYSTDGGKTWTRFGPALKFTLNTTPSDIPAGLIAVSVRGGRKLGQDHIVLYPPDALTPEYSQDGGATWQVTQSFPLYGGGMQTGYNTWWNSGISEHLLRADPFTPDKFYLKLSQAPDTLYISTDGGKTWVGQPGANLPATDPYGQLAVNEKVQNDLWYVDGWEGGSTHGLFHSTDGGQTFQQLAGINHASVIAVGAGSGNAGDAPYSVYFYGQLATSPDWGVFRSTDAGASWDRIAYYPTGTYNNARAMAASQDTFGKVYIGLGGQSFIYGQLTPTAPVIPGAPTGLTAIATTSAAVNLTWTAPAGTVSGYSVYRGTSAGAEAATPLATGVATTAYSDTSVAAGTGYYYKVTASNAAGEGPASNEASATTPNLAVPSAPTGVVANAVSNSEIDLSWSAPAGSVATYNLYRGTSAGGEGSSAYATGVTGTAYSDKGLKSGTAYFYKVTAVNAAGEGPSSAEATATTQASTIGLAMAAGSASAITVTGGQVATYQLVLSTSNYSGTITFSCSGASAGETCTVPAPASITPATTTTPIKVTVQTSPLSAAVPSRLIAGMALLSVMLVLPVGGFARRFRARVTLIIVAVGILSAISGCSGGSGGGSSKPNPVTSTLTVSASGTGVTTATQTLTLTVQ